MNKSNIEALDYFWRASYEEKINSLKETLKQRKRFTDEIKTVEIDFSNQSKEEKDKFLLAQKNMIERYTSKMKELERMIEIFSIKTLLELNPITPTIHYMQNTKIFNNLDVIIKNSPNEIGVNVAPSNKKEVITLVTATIEKNMILSKEITQYDKNVLDSCITLFVNGNENFTIDQVYRCMNGFKNNEKVTEKSRKDIENSIDKMRLIFIEIDFSEEAKMRNLKDVEKCKLQSYLLNADKVDMKASGKIVKAYHMNTEPAIYKYGNAVKQIIAVDPKLLDTKLVLKNNIENTQIKRYLLQRIKNIKSSPKISNTIRYETIFNNCKIDNMSPVKAKRLRDGIKKLLEFWINEKEIKRYEELKATDKKTIIGIKIFY